MFDDLVCPRPAYERLEANGLIKRILKKDTREAVDDILLHSNPYDYEGEKTVLSFIKKGADNGIPTLSPFSGRVMQEHTEMFRNINAFYQEFDTEPFEGGFEHFESLLVKYPDFLGYLALQNDLPEKYSQFGFPTRKSLAEAVTSFCIGETELIRNWGNEIAWRNRNFKNVIFLNEHGDLYAGQIDVSGKDEFIQTLFGPVNVFDTMKQIPERKAVHAYQDWSQFLIATLKYAQQIGMADMPEITRWREHLEKFGGGVGTNTAEAMFGSGGLERTMIENEMQEAEITTCGVKIKESKKWPLTISSRESTFFPYLRRKLIYLKEIKDGKEKQKGFKIPEFEGTTLADSRFEKTLQYDETDLPLILGATYKFFARDRTLLPVIMNIFLKITS